MSRQQMRLGLKARSDEYKRLLLEYPDPDWRDHFPDAEIGLDFYKPTLRQERDFRADIWGEDDEQAGG